MENNQEPFWMEALKFHRKKLTASSKLVGQTGFGIVNTGVTPAAEDKPLFSLSLDVL